MPHAWKRLGEAVYCQSCWRERYTVRSVALPVVEPLGEEWHAFAGALKVGWVQATAAANWMVTELYARDVRRNGDEKMPRMARAYLYPDARIRFPELAPQTVVSIENSVQAAYRAKRYEVVWIAAASLPSFRYPMPLPLHNQSWEPGITQERPVVRVRLGNRWWDLRLKSSPRFGSQTQAFRQLVSGEAIKGELALYRVRAQEGKLVDRPNRDQTVRYTVMCKMVAWFPREEQKDAQRRNGTLRVRTADELLLIADNSDDGRIWRYHGDHLRRWAAEHRKALENFADDQKAEQRPVPSFADRRTAAALKYRNRMGSAIREISAQLVGYGVRRNFSTIDYNDSVTGFCPGFPYAALRDQIRTKCDAEALNFRHSKETAESGTTDNDRQPASKKMTSGPPVGPARPMADTLDGLTTRGRL
ncbi:MAG TPA: hypothetical protein VG096_08605 [Bryobacteraceae bacterium]|nr:hypothetical protein [Bryobacteraceae bacterium]